MSNTKNTLKFAAIGAVSLIGAMNEVQGASSTIMHTEFADRAGKVVLANALVPNAAADNTVGATEIPYSAVDAQVVISIIDCNGSNQTITLQASTSATVPLHHKIFLTNIITSFTLMKLDSLDLVVCQIP